MKPLTHKRYDSDALSIYSFTDSRKKSDEIDFDSKSLNENHTLETLESSRLLKEKFYDPQTEISELEESVKHKNNMLQMQLDQGEKLHEQRCEILRKQPQKNQVQDQSQIQSMIGLVLGTVIGYVIHFSF